MRLYWFGLLTLLAFRLWFAAVLPMTGDEAYFVFWGEHPAGGYYDHPPMVGWWLGALLTLSRAEWFLRLPAVVLPLILAWGAWWLVRVHGAERARLGALLILLQPANVLNVLITTDTPVILFSFLSILAYVAALRSEQQSRGALLWHALAGALLGLAFLGKYFAALLGMAYLVHVVFIRRDAARWPGFALLVVAAMPAPLYNLWWNSSHCWVNILFNFINRNADAGFSWQNPVLYLVSLVFLATPWVLFEVWRERQKLREIVRASVEASAAFWLMLVPLALFALMSLWRSIGLHWLFSFIPLLGVLAAIVLPPAVLPRLVRWSAAFAVIQALVIVLTATLPLQTWKNNRLYTGIVMTIHAEDVLHHLEAYASDYLFAMEGYSMSATLAFNSQRSFAVFGVGSYHARQDDFITDWRAHDGRNVLILLRKAPKKGNYEAFFNQVEFEEIVVQGVRLYLVLGQGFNYAVYHEKILTRIRQSFYRIPTWLPQRDCEFTERYFPEMK